MPILHDPENPRHARLFELLRQNDVVETMASRVHDFNIRKVNQDEMDVIKRVAARSIQRVN
ncbi:MAG: hypothetical protein P8Q26_05280 [Ascidiaceihabitans sp.]|nr:hypothetical protein [Ascidiaceihabitans sp.]